MISSNKVLFVLNPESGNSNNDFQKEILDFFFNETIFEIDFFTLDWENNPKEAIQKLIENKGYNTIVASGGDGTVKFIAEIIYGTDINLGILPTGSANGLAKNLNIPTDFKKALSVITNGKISPVSSISVNGNFCIHLADIGLNASIVKRFEQQKTRGFLGYGIALKNVIFQQKPFIANIQTETDKMQSKVYMLVFCNGTGYGSGLAINPDGNMDDFKFEVVSVKKLSLLEGMRLYFGQDKPRPEYAKITSCSQIEVNLPRKVHLQIDGEYLGQTKQVKVVLNPYYIHTLVS